MKALTFKEKYYSVYEEKEVEEIEDLRSVIHDVGRWVHGYIPDDDAIDQVVNDYLRNGCQAPDLDFSESNLLFYTMKDAFEERGILLMANGQIRRKSESKRPFVTKLVFDMAEEVSGKKYHMEVYLKGRPAARVIDGLKMIQDVTGKPWQASFDRQDVKRIKKRIAKEKKDEQ